MLKETVLEQGEVCDNGGMSSVSMVSDCEICPFLVDQTANDMEVLLQTDRWVVVLDKNQDYLGKSFVTLREHKETLSDLDDIDWSDLHEVVRLLEGAIKRAFGANVVNWECLMNNAVMRGQPTHVHWKVYPRYVGGASFDGEVFPDDKWPRHREGGKHIVDDILFARISGKLKDELYGD